ncbi:hypothetical protein BJX76DRAFT_345693 [Aspergillus varians]
MDCLNGRWIMEKSHCTGTDGMLKLQGIGWTLRKAIGLTTLRLDVSSYQDNTPSGSGATVIDVLATPTGGLAGTREKRIMDWTAQDHKDYLFGACQHQSRFVYGVKDEQGKVYPDVDMQTQAGKDNENVKRFLRGEILENGEDSAWSVPETGSSDAGAKDVWVHTLVRNLDAGWTAEQVWGFEVINGERYHTRRIVTATPKGEYVLGRLAYRLSE